MSGVRFYLLLICSMLPGYLIGSGIVVLWYGIVLYLVSRRDIGTLFKVFMVWSFLSSGAYHYGMLGDQRSTLLVNYFDEFLIVAAGYLFISSHHRHPFAWNEHRLVILMMMVALVSGLMNGVPLLDLFNYFTSTFRWFFFLYLLSVMVLPERYFAELFGLGIGIILFNSVFGFLQTTVLPIQTTPDGYTPAYLDVASGFLGVTTSQFLTVLCLGFVMYFLPKYLLERKNIYVVYIGILLLQPFFSSSKAALVVGAGFILMTLILLQLRARVQLLNVMSIVRIGSVLFLVFIGFTYYQSINERYFGQGLDIVSEYFDRKQALTDFKKVRGYLDAINFVAPQGAGGAWFGVGPTNFTSGVGLKNQSSLAMSLRLDVDAGKESSVDVRTTDMTGLIGEVGYAGALLFVLYLLQYSVRMLSRARNAVVLEHKVQFLFAAQWAFLILFFSFYERGFLTPYYYTIFIAATLMGIPSRSPNIEVRGRS